MQQIWEQSIKSFQNALTLNTNDLDAATNLAFMKSNVEMIKQLPPRAALRARQEAEKFCQAAELPSRAGDHGAGGAKERVAAKQFQVIT